MDAFLRQMFNQQAGEILQAEANNARRQAEAAAARRAQEEAEMLRRQHEEQRRRQAEDAQRLLQQQWAATRAALQAQRTSNWYGMNPTR